MQRLIGKKIGMTSVFNTEGNNIPCTVIEAGPCVVTQVKTKEKEGVNAFQLAWGDKKEKHWKKTEVGHFKASGSTPKKVTVDVRDPRIERKVGEVIDSTVFNEGEYVDVIANSKGKGFQGVVKRHGFAGVGESTHGQHNRLRAPGSIGACSTPSRVFKGTRMAGRTGNNRVKVINLEIIKIYPDKNLILVKGAVPGYNGTTVILEK
ncbi:MAG: 50S ribosomal protein L3 [Bacteroidetes bacterium]|nr:50S ribosomal protein L3 [Bacteroidota bacterium]